jgi:hypothetical protein
VGTVLIVMGFVLAQDLSQVGLVPDEGAVHELAAASADPAFGDRVHAGRLYVAEYGPDACVGEDGVKRGGEVRAAVADHEWRTGGSLTVPRGWMPRACPSKQNPGNADGEGT